MTQKIIDLSGGLGEGTIIDFYINFHDNPLGDELAVCRFHVRRRRDCLRQKHG
jgi:hypothetical protein